ncbi:autotransporter outer membrane beta-barrel domain-containing protein [Acuticoccus kandeliae]|uniref:autotransporter outer membrane beta-barrel domain-containing protein n=1 Tax=Acuticoccus kandeliae TaxID=2073160 RepID=UPI000D3E3631|nr:autotransporter outer membrane beta-barrel domain-containing protein [Acuticoccus kandeliae]
MARKQRRNPAASSETTRSDEGRDGQAPGGILRLQRQARVRRIASSLLFQSTALAGTMAGLPIYSRAYAQASCSPSVTSYTIDGSQDFDAADIASMRKATQQTFTCTIDSSTTITTPQYAYGGAYAYYQNAPTNQLYLNDDNYVLTRKGSYFGWNGLNITITNNADISVGSSADTTSIIANNTSSDDLLFQKKTQYNALSVYSRGSMALGGDHAYSSSKQDYVKNPAGLGGAISITNTGSVSSSIGAGIYAFSSGGLQVDGGENGVGGDVSVTTSGDVSGAKGGIIAVSQGGFSTIQAPYGGEGTGAVGGTVTVAVTGAANVSATTTGPGVFAASYGGNALYQTNTFGQYIYGGGGGAGGDATVNLGSSTAAMTGTISTADVGTNAGPQQIIRKTGAAVAAVSVGGVGVYAGVFISGGGAGGDATVNAYGSSDTMIKTGGGNSPAILAQSVGGAAQAAGYNDLSLSGGDAGTATVNLSGGGNIQTTGSRSIGILGQSLGGAGRNDDIYVSTYGQAGKGGNVAITSDFNITNTGDYGHGIVAQSAAASFATAIYDNAGDSSIVWGDTNDTATGSSSVTVTNTGTINVSGTDAHGIVAQSIGGGGGILTNSDALSTNSVGLVDTSASQSIGGYASANGNAVTVNNRGAITTSGKAATATSSGSSDDTIGGGIAILAQSIGGGGGTSTGQGSFGQLGGSGNASGNGSIGGAVTVNNYATLTTYGDEGHGIVAQSIGGGGGAGRNAKGLFHSVGGSGGAGGNGGTVVVKQNGDIAVAGDSASAVIAQSIGGGGGVGGTASSWGLFFASSVGGSGGPGGDGGSATVTAGSAATISTKGDHGIGLHVQSIGGGGGTGGAAKASSDGIGFSIAIATGGRGGVGGTGGTASATLEGNLTTEGKDAIGILSQSIGGGGGAGGAATAKAVTEGVPFDEDGNTFALSLTVAHGGDGGKGGNAAEATGFVNQGASLTTSGDGATGVVVQSIGGGGGAGGDSTATAVTKSLSDLFGGDDNDDDDDDSDDGDDTDTKNYSLNLSFAFGGQSGTGGDGAAAYGHIQGTIKTTGDLADGLLVQSIGGGGGAGGAGTGSASTAKGATSASLGIDVGAKGGVAGNGGRAQGGLSDNGYVSTAGHGSRGVLVQSIGGGGGAGGGGSGTDSTDWDITIGIGGDGGGGGHGGAAYGWNAGTIVTSGDFADAILVQSIGGGGGAAGLGKSSVTFQDEKDDDDDNDDDSDSDADKSGDDDDDDDASHTITIGNGGGGGGGNGGDVFAGVGKDGGALKLGTITTHGAFSHGVHAQSIGGGGGTGATAQSNDDSSSSSSSSATASSSDDDDDDDTPDASLTIGANGGDGGTGGTVTVYGSTTTTYGFASSAIVAQSIGGGGGTGLSSGFSVSSVKLSLGSKDVSSGGGTGGTVNVTVESGQTLTTNGANAHGVIAQSIGAGGGLGIVALGSASDTNDESLSDIIDITLGSNSDQKNLNDLDGGDVTVTHEGAIVTSEERSIGIVAQSIGGGGGFISASSANIKSVSFESDQQRGAGYNAEVSLTSGTITTSGDGAAGIVAQSIGGGGGFAGDLTQKLNAYYAGYKANYKYSGGDGRHSGTVTVKVDSNSSISTTGKYAHGIIAQSVAGSGGIFEKNGKTYAGSLHRNGPNNEAAVNVTVDGSVSVASPSSWAVWTQVQNTTSTIVIGSTGTVSGAIGSGYGGAIYGATDKNSGSTSIEVSGTLSGNVTANRGTITVKDGGTFVSGFVNIDTLYVATSSSGSGALDSGGKGNIFQSYIDGNLIAQPSGSDAVAATIVNFDVAAGLGGTDSIVVTGSFSGDWSVGINAMYLQPNYKIDIIKPTATVEGSTITVQSSDVFKMAPVTQGSDGWFSTTIESANFSAVGATLGHNNREIANGLQSAWDTLAARGNGVRAARPATAAPTDGGPRIGEVFATFHTATEETFEDMLATFASHASLGAVARAPTMAISTASRLMTCEGFTEGAFVGEGECAWMAGLGATADHDGFQDSDPGFTVDTYGFQAGGQAEIAESWFLGGTFGYERGDYRGDAYGQTLDTDTGFAAVSVKKEIGGFVLGAAVGGGYTWGDAKRTLVNGTYVATVEGSPDSSYVFGRVRGAYTYAFSDWGYIRPAIDVDVINIDQKSYKETGAGALNLMVDGQNQTLFAFTPSLEIGAKVNITETLPARLFANAGVTFLTDDTFTSTARFEGVPTMDSFETATSLGDAIARVGVGIDIAAKEGFELKLQYDGAFSDDVQSHGGSLRLGYRF